MTPGTPWTDLDRPPLREAALRAALCTGDGPAWRALDVVARTGSTQADLVTRAGWGEPEGLVLLADEQTAGRGRRGRSWQAPPRAGIAVSVLLRPAVPPARWAWLALLGGVAVTDALPRVCGLSVGLKWPNDVLVLAPDGDDGRVTERKVAGLLAEVTGPSSDGDRAVVLGIGINVTQQVAELPVPEATSLRLAGAATTDRETVARAVLRSLADRYAEWQAADGDPRGGGIAAAYRERCTTLGRAVRVQLPATSTQAPTLEGVAEGVDDDGRLVVRDIAGTAHELSAGDVVHVR